MITDGISVLLLTDDRDAFMSTNNKKKRDRLCIYVICKPIERRECDRFFFCSSWPFEFDNIIINARIVKSYFFLYRLENHLRSWLWALLMLFFFRFSVYQQYICIHNVLISEHNIVCSPGEEKNLIDPPFPKESTDLGATTSEIFIYYSTQYIILV